MNLHRRHMSESQRAVVAAQIATLKVGDVNAQRDGLQICRPLSVTEAASLLNVSPSSIANAKIVLKEGTP